MQLKMTKTKIHPRIGKMIHRFSEPWKVSAMAEIAGEPVIMAYSNVSRSDSQIWLRGRVEYSDHAETLGQPLVYGDYIISAGECGDLVYSYKWWHPKTRFKLGWATTTCVFNGRPVVIDRPDNDAKHVVVRDCETGATVQTMPGAYIALDSCEWGGKLWAAIGWDQGLSCSDGKLYRAKACQSVCVFRNHLLFSSGNKVLTLKAGKIVTMAELPCEKIMQLEVVEEDMLYIVGAGPDTLWTVDAGGNISTAGVVADGSVGEVGGVCFGWCATRNYFARPRKGSRKINGRQTDCGEVYEIV